MPKNSFDKLRFSVVVFGCFLGISSQAFADIVLEYHTPTPDSSPADLALDGRGNIWFTEINANRIGMLDPTKAKSLTSEGITEYELPNPNSRPYFLTVAKNGMIWFTEGGNRIGSLDPKTGKIKEYDIPSPHSEPHQIAEGQDGTIWFLEFHTNKIGRLDPLSGKITEFPVGSGNPHALVLVGNKVWYTQGGMYWVNIFFNKLGSMDIKTGNVEETIIPPEKSVPHGLAAAKDGTIWLTEMFASKLGKLDLKQKKPKIQEYHLGGERKPHGISFDEKRGYVWFTAANPFAIGSLDLSQAKPGTGQGVKYYNLPDPNSRPTQILVDENGNVWFTEMGEYFQGKFNNKIGLLVPCEGKLCLDKNTR
ncbi:MAG: Lyase-like protein [Nitrospinota bacterium]|nr:Lyase-like protein [Nitrospinota bacterium]